MPISNPEQLPTTGKIIAFDVGSKTVGLALSDKSRTIASPLKTLKREKWTKDKEIIRQIIEKELVTCAVVGLPLNMMGEETPQTKSCISFAMNVEEAMGIPVLLWDERLSTVSATNALFEQRQGRQTRASKKDIKAQVDSVAAAIFLQAVLEGLRFRGGF
ncbi:MAG: Holliday junction resolvase RuvX [Magnetococcales bacterium]|nr:Holliday junction resolvase RuvX [Magnetococcales bacterium]PPR18799.1 MAG: putative pre-16S rRNA nuclease [Pseudomonadota bacterium]|tara:strand:- start:746 stop:1225 length:480 start_codon:yes stop_codon:yes gene_type:complete